MLVAFNIEKSDAQPRAADACGFTLLNQRLHRAEPSAEGRILYFGGHSGHSHRCIGSADAKLRKTLLRCIFTAR
jgi:hypothetical protein